MPESNSVLFSPMGSCASTGIGDNDLARSPAPSLLGDIARGTARIGIIGLGYVGLPLARAFADARLRGPGLRRRPRQGRAGSQRGESYIGHIPRRGRSGEMREQGFEATDRLRPPRRARRHHHLRADAADRGPRAGPDLRRQVGPRRSPPGCGPASSSSWRARPTPAPRARSSCPSWRPAGLEAGQRLLPGLQPRARGPRQPRLLGTAPSPRSSAASTQPACELAAALYGQVVVRGRAGLQPRGRRGLQDPGEHLPRRQHRPGQRAEGALRPDGHRRLGGDRGGQDQAVRLPGVLSRARAGRALHPDRPVLPDLGRPQVRPDDALHRAGRRDQHGDARLRRRARSPTRSTTAASRSRGARSRCWAWPTRRTWTTPASRPASS